MIEAVALLVFGAFFIGVALASARWTPFVAIGGLMAALGIARILLP